MIYAKVSRSDLYQMIKSHSYNPFTHCGLNTLLDFLWDSTDHDDYPTLFNVTDLLIEWHEDTLEETLDQFNCASLEELQDYLSIVLVVPHSHPTSVIYKQ